MTKLNQQQYAKYAGISQQAVSKKVKKYMAGKAALKTMPGVTKVEKIGRMYIIYCK